MDLRISKKTFSNILSLNVALLTVIFATKFVVASSETEPDGIQGGMPIGAVMNWGSLDIPNGWLTLDGSSTSGYPELAEIYGATLPDLRGRFVRGVGGYSGALNAIQLSSVKAHGHAATFSGNALPPHSHSYTRNDQQTRPDGIDDDSRAASNSFTNKTTSSVSAGTPTGTVTVNPSIGSETRPENVAMLFIVKAM